MNHWRATPSAHCHFDSFGGNSEYRGDTKDSAEDLDIFLDFRIVANIILRCEHVHETELTEARNLRFAVAGWSADE